MECLDITRSCVHPRPQMDVMSAVIMGSLWQAYWDSLQKGAFSFTDTTWGDCWFITVACNLELQILTQAVRAMSPHWHIAKQLQSQGIKASLTPASPWTESPKQESHNTEHHISKATVSLQDDFGGRVYHPNNELHKSFPQLPESWLFAMAEGIKRTKLTSTVPWACSNEEKCQ